MLAALFNGVLPIFAISVIGYGCGKIKIFDFGSAMILNKFVMFIAMPILGFKLLSAASLFDVPMQLLVGYLLSEICVYLITFIIARKVFGVGVKEAFLLGLATALTNHVLFILPIAEILIGPTCHIADSCAYFYGWHAYFWWHNSSHGYYVCKRYGLASNCS